MPMSDNRTPGSADEGATPIVPAAMVAQLYDELREIARQQMSRERPGQTLQTTALVHEAFVRIGGKWSDGSSSDGAKPNERFFQAAAIAMRRILIDRARAKRTVKRGGGRPNVPLEDAEIGTIDDSTDWLALDDALRALETQDTGLAQLVSLRYFAGLSVDQTAAAMGVSARTVDRDWRLARAFLQRHLLDAKSRDA